MSNTSKIKEIIYKKEGELRAIDKKLHESQIDLDNLQNWNERTATMRNMLVLRKARARINWELHSSGIKNN